LASGSSVPSKVRLVELLERVCGRLGGAFQPTEGVLKASLEAKTHNAPAARTGDGAPREQQIQPQREALRAGHVLA
jgi:hypothetical protein